ncbi:hypothetical protein pb186bvf_013022 [Paramecium bursaria]
MSVYSGFSSKQLETQYNKLIVSLIKVLQRRILKFYKQEEADEIAFKQIITDTKTKLNQMEQSKYCQPYISEYLQDISECLKIDFLPIKNNFENKTTFITGSENQASNHSSSRKHTALSTRRNSNHIRQTTTQFYKIPTEKQNYFRQTSQTNRKGPLKYLNESYDKQYIAINI